MNTSDWANTEFDGVDLGDKRLNKRLVKITDQFISSTQSPINHEVATLNRTHNLKYPENLAYYIDYEKMGRDMELGGDIYTIEIGFEEIHIFWNH